MARHVNLPSGTVTFLFTDIEGSTKRWESQPDAMRSALAQHDAILREAIQSNGGYVFKTMGDAFCAAFPTAPQAVAAALQAQRELRAFDWSSLGIEALQARMALHTGSAEIRDEDYFGLPLNRVARLLATGHGGQILLSLATHQLVRDQLPKGTDLRDLGSGGLRDLVRTEHVFQLVAPDLPADFPPLKALDARYIEPLSAGEAGLQVNNPYKGLRAFQEQDAADFFGREALTARLVSRLREKGALARFLAVVGPSGSGKSSVVKAGLLPALRRGEVEGSEHWLILQMLPGSHPLEELDALLLSVAATANPPATLLELLQADERGLIRAAKRVLPQDDNVEIVLVIDQFEEVFTLIEDEAPRAHFLGLLCAAVTEPRSRVHVIVTLRADFYDRPLLYPDPGELVRQRTEVVLPLSAEELERAIVRPGARAGVELEAELVASIIKDVGEQPGALPLLQYALTELFDKRAGRILTLETYAETGGVLGALSRRAEEIYAELSPGEQHLTRQLLLRLVTLGEGNEDTRRRVRMAELASISDDPGQLERIIDEFGQHRLLTYDRDPVTGGRTVEVAHEALIRTWPRLREWLDASRVNLRIHRQLMAAAVEWETSGRDASFLAAGARLAHFETLANDIYSPRGVALNEEERAYLAASLDMRREQERAEQERQGRELLLARQSAVAQKNAANPLRVLVAGLAVFLLVAAALVIFALSRQAEADTQRVEAQHSAATAVANADEAQKQREIAQTNLAQAQVQRWAAEASSLVQAESDPELALLLSIRSLKARYSPEGDAALMMSARQPLPQQVFTGHTDIVQSVAISPDGKWLLTGSNDTTARLWDVGTSQEIRRFDTSGFVGSVAFSSDGTKVLVGGNRSVQLIDAQSGYSIHEFAGSLADIVLNAALSHDGSFVVAGLTDGTVHKWDAKTGKELVHFSAHSGATDVYLSADDKYMVTVSGDQTAALWDAATAKRIQVFAGITGFGLSAALSPDDKQLVTGGRDGSVTIWDAQTGAQLHLINLTGGVQVYSVNFSHDGRWIVAGDSKGVTHMWDAQTWDEIYRFVGHTGTVTGIAFSPDGKYLATAGTDKIARLWRIQPQAVHVQFIGHAQRVTSLVLSPDGKYAITGSFDKTARLWDFASGMELHVFGGHTDAVYALDFSPDGKYVVISSPGDTMSLWDVASGKKVLAFPTTSYVWSGEFSPDGKYLLTGDVAGEVAIWDTQTGYVVRGFGGHTGSVNGLSFSPDGRYVLTSGWDNTAYMWQASSGKPFQKFAGHTGPVEGVAFSPDGKYVLTTSDDKTARLWDTQTGAEARRFIGHTGALYADPQFSPDGNYVYTSASDGTLRQWDTQTGVEVRRISIKALGVDFAGFLSGGKYIVGVSGSIVQIWDANWQDTVSRACRGLRRDFTDDERQQYGITDKSPTCPR